MNVTDCSKFLSFVLRHKPDSIGIVLDSAGWVDVDMLLDRAKADGKYISEALLKKVVAENSKKRFEFSKDETAIRASQGHSVKVDLDYVATVPPEFLFHGTCEQSAPFIVCEGIKKMNRHHVHLSDNRATATQVGKRHGNAVVLVVKALEMHSKGFEFFKSTNGVWLTDTVPKEYIL